ncbi:MAG: response regulator [Leptolyngbyaceae cyanobacterium CSU_1_3]|nr:response regulator [Leptolyngbyaceae cyanobacterium CSU_1_3]
MPSFDPHLHQSLTWSVFHQIGSLLKLFNQPEAIVFTESRFPSFNCQTGLAERFVVVVAPQFSALLTGESDSSKPRSGDDSRRCQIGLSFEPGAIAIFLTRLEALKVQPLAALLQQAKAVLQPNDPIAQSQFTLQLVELLGGSGLHSSAETALRQQVEQERLINEVTTLIRQSLELPVILETAVQQVRRFLKADRLIIYQFNIPTPSCLLDESIAPPEQQTPELDGITYEARGDDSIPSVLHQINADRAEQPFPNELTWAIADCETSGKGACFMPFADQQVRAELVTPIVVRDELWGLLIAHQCFESRHWQESERAFLQRIAGHLTIAIYQAKLYAQVQQQKETLEHQVVDRTQELRDTLVTAQAANRAKSEFLATMSHELRSPLTTIIGMASTLLRYQLSQSNTKGALTLQKQQEYLQTIQSRGEHLLALINDILDLSQVETGKTILDVQEFSLFALAHHTLDLLQEKAARRNVELHLDARSSDSYSRHQKDDTLRADYQRIKQILLNLLSNAIKFTPENGSITLRIWFNDDTAVLQVEDTGIGIHPHQIPLLFQKFQQLDTSYHRKYEGTGLGLALTKQLVELHGGKIEVTSTIGVGSKFTVHVPTQSPKNNRTRQSRFSALSAHPRILLIESHEETATLICDLLTAASYQVVWTIEGTTALRQIEMLQPVAVIIDVQLSGMDGYQIIRHLRQDAQTQDLCILALVAAPATERAKCLKAGADDCLVKPIVQPEHLIDKVLGLLAKNGLRAGEAKGFA